MQKYCMHYAFAYLVNSPAPNDRELVLIANLALQTFQKSMDFL